MTLSDRVAESGGDAIVRRTAPATQIDVVESGHDGSSRRRSAGTTSARSLLMTILGEFVLPGHAVVWTASLVAAMGALDVEEKAARQAIARAAAEGPTGRRADRSANPVDTLRRMADASCTTAPPESTASCAPNAGGTATGS